MPIDDSQTGRYHIHKKESFCDMQLKTKIRPKSNMKRSHLIAILALAALILSLVIYSLVKTISNDHELKAFSKPLFSCPLPPNTAKVVEVAYRIGGITTMDYDAYLLIRSDLNETELQQYFQANVFSLTEIKRKSDLHYNVIENRWQIWILP